jgi:hypothetical protein
VEPAATIHILELLGWNINAAVSSMIYFNLWNMSIVLTFVNGPIQKWRCIMGKQITRTLRRHIYWTRKRKQNQQNVVYMKKNRCSKERKKGGWGNIGSCPHVASCYRFSCYYRFSDIAINSVNPSFIWRLEFSKNG